MIGVFPMHWNPWDCIPIPGPVEEEGFPIYWLPMNEVSPITYVLTTRFLPTPRASDLVAVS